MTLKDWLKKTGKDQRDLALPLGRSPSQISRLVNGRSKPSWDVAQRIFEFTDGEVTPNDWLPAPESPEQVAA